MKLDMNQQQLLARYHDAQTTDAENQQVQSLLAANPDGQAYLNQLSQLSQSLQSAYTMPQISESLAERLRDIPHAAQEHALTRLAGGWSLAACILLLLSALAIFQYQANTTIDSDAWQLDRMAIGQTTSQYGVELTDNHRDLQLASLLIAQGAEASQ
ncbi:MAG: hypothetical protein CMJ19_01985 [Phycisphaeraceae bacterium]|nr:hypothetical protein [Phycisphaeraceae bacterium]